MGTSFIFDPLSSSFTVISSKSQSSKRLIKQEQNSVVEQSFQGRIQIVLVMV